MASLGIRPYNKGLVDLGRGGYAWLQPDGGWGWSNAGLVTDGDQALLVDTLFDVRLTAEMLAAMKRAEPRRASISSSTRIQRRTLQRQRTGRGRADHRVEGDGRRTHSRVAAHDDGVDETSAEHGRGRRVFSLLLRRVPLRRSQPDLPTRTFEGALELTVGDNRVQLSRSARLKHAATRSCTSGGRLVFTGDILFIEGHRYVGGTGRQLDRRAATTSPRSTSTSWCRGTDPSLTNAACSSAPTTSSAFEIRRGGFDSGMNPYEAAWTFRSPITRAGATLNASSST